jgi:hypothetical protein
MLPEKFEVDFNEQVLGIELFSITGQTKTSKNRQEQVSHFPMQKMKSIDYSGLQRN